MPQNANSYNARFNTYLNYLSAVSEFLGHEDMKLDQHYHDVFGSRDFNSLIIVQKNQERLNTTYSYLRSAWVTEQCVRMQQQENCIRLLHHWNFTKLYFSFHSALYAYFSIKSIKPADAHLKDLNSIANTIDLHPMMFPSFLRVLQYGKPEDYNFKYVPAGVKISKVTKGNSVEFWDRYGQLMRTTHQRYCNKKIDTWKDNNNRSNISSDKKLELCNGETF